MIRFAAFLVAVAFGLLVAGGVTSKLFLVYLAIGVSAVALLSLGIGVLIKRREIFGTPETTASNAAATPDIIPTEHTPPTPVPVTAAPPVAAARPVAASTGSTWPPSTRPGSVWESAVPPTGIYPTVRPAAPVPGYSAAPPAKPDREDMSQAPAAFTRPNVGASPSATASPPPPGVWDWPADSVQARPAPAQVFPPSVTSQPPPGVDEDMATAIDLPAVIDRRAAKTPLPPKQPMTKPDLRVPPYSTHRLPVSPKDSSPSAPASAPPVPVPAPVEAASDPTRPEPAPAWPEAAITPVASTSAEPVAAEPAEPVVAEPEPVPPEIAAASTSAEPVVVGSESAPPAPAPSAAPAASPASTEAVAAPSVSAPPMAVKPEPVVAVPEPAPADAVPESAEPGAVADPDPDPDPDPAPDTDTEVETSPTADSAPADAADSGPDLQTIVTVVPGVPRYHNATCILIRFMGEGDLDKMTVATARDAGCTPCRACLPD